MSQFRFKSKSFATIHTVIAKATTAPDYKRIRIIGKRRCHTCCFSIPDSAWEYRLGSRSALEWVLDQYKERTPRDPTIRERFNTYRFADHKEHVIDLLKRVCTVSVETVRIVNQFGEMSDISTGQNSD